MLFFMGPEHRKGHPEGLPSTCVNLCVNQRQPASTCLHVRGNGIQALPWCVRNCIQGKAAATGFAFTHHAGIGFYLGRFRVKGVIQHMKIPALA
jgi:hypothetical protein